MTGLMDLRSKKCSKEQIVLFKLTFCGSKIIVTIPLEITLCSFPKSERLNNVSKFISK